MTAVTCRAHEPRSRRSRAPEVRRVVATYRDALRTHQDELNRLNVYPVPDGDTGTNMALTLESVCAELESADGMDEVCRADRARLAHGRPRQLGRDPLADPARLRRHVRRASSASARRRSATGLRRAADAAYQAVLRPVEGTILTVVRDAAEAAEAARGTARRRCPTCSTARSRPRTSRSLRTPELLPVLKEAGVVDAGGRGFALLLDAFLDVVAERPLPEPRDRRHPGRRSRPTMHGDDVVVAALRGHVPARGGRRDHPALQATRGARSATRSSSSAATASGTATCTPTTSAPRSRPASRPAGPARSASPTCIEQVEEEQWVREQPSTATAAPTAHVRDRGVVAVGVGDGVQRLLTSLGVHEVVAGGQSMNPSTAQILEAVERCRRRAA